MLFYSLKQILKCLFLMAMWARVFEIIQPDPGGFIDIVKVPAVVLGERFFRFIRVFTKPGNGKSRGYEKKKRKQHRENQVKMPYQ